MTRTLRRLTATEADTLRTITDFLDLQLAQGKLVYIRHNPSNVVGKKGEATFRRPRASQLGVADLIVFRFRVDKHPDGHWDNKCGVLCIEVKSATGKLSPAQERWAKKAVAQGCKYIVARSLEDATKAMK